MGKIESAVAWAIQIANDNSHGYSQADRWGPDYDCSSFVISAFDQAGVPVREAGASYTGNMYSAFRLCGFQDVSGSVDLYTGAGLQAGDVLLNRASHTCLCIGGGRVANCRTDEGHPQTGDQGQEIRLQNFWPYPWDCALRYVGDNSQPETPAEPAAPRSTLKKGMSGEDVKQLQQKLEDAGYKVGSAGVDGIFGNDTFKAVAAFQEEHGIPVTGVADPETIRALNDAPPKEQVFSLPELQSGSRGDGAVFLQAALNLLNYNCGTADGIFGAKSTAALNRFKEVRLLPTDGKADAALWEELLNELRKGVRK